MDTCYRLVPCSNDKNMKESIGLKEYLMNDKIYKITDEDHAIIMRIKYKREDFLLTLQLKSDTYDTVHLNNLSLYMTLSSIK